MESSEVVDVLGALAQETRLEVFRRLVEAAPDGEPAGEIARGLGIPAQTLSFHLRAMSHAGLVAQRREGRSLIYSANFDVLNDVIRFLTDNCCSRSPAPRPPARPRRGRARPPA